MAVGKILHYIVTCMNWYRFLTHGNLRTHTFRFFTSTNKSRHFPETTLEGLRVSVTQYTQLSNYQDNDKSHLWFVHFPILTSFHILRFCASSTNLEPFLLHWYHSEDFHKNTGTKSSSLAVFTPTTKLLALTTFQNIWNSSYLNETSWRTAPLGRMRKLSLR